ncbi:MAG: hypothetical protein ACI9UA_005131 [Pseudoalteromonas tetraodonis]|jgi:hypothetical protein
MVEGVSKHGNHKLMEIKLLGVKIMKFTECCIFLLLIPLD